jgi:hypothetical protein
MQTTGADVPVILILTEGGLSVVGADWGMDDVVLHTCGPAELEARIKLAIGRNNARRDADDPDSHVIRSGEVVVDDATYTAKLGGRRSTSRSRSSSSSSSSPSTRAGSSPASSCCRRSGATTTSAAPAPSTSTSAACAPSSAPRTRP